MSKPIYLDIILHISKTDIYEFWYDYVKQKYGDKAKLCYMDTDSLIPYIKTEDVFEDTAYAVERWFDTSNNDENDKRLLPIVKNKRVPDLFKEELGGKNIKELCAVRSKTWLYFKMMVVKKKKAKGTKKL